MNNILLISWAKLFRRTLCILSKLNIDQENTIFSDSKNSSLLHLLQNDILNNHVHIFNNIFSYNTTINKIINKNMIRFFRFDDNSISVHVCHSLQREIEILHDNLLAMISDDPLLLPHEIVVMAPNIDQYVSSIQSVFSQASAYGRHLPFSIFEYKINNLDPILLVFLKLLRIPYIRFTINEVLDFLKIPAISKRFDIDQSGVVLLQKWILESGIRWGLNNDILDELMVPSYKAQYTWQFGLTRMLLGYAMNLKQGSWEEILPYNISLYQDTEESVFLIGQLGKFLMQLHIWKIRLNKSYFLKEWLPYAQEIINDFFIEDFDTNVQSTLIVIKNYWMDIVSSGIKANYLKPVSIQILYDKLNDKLRRKRINHRFFSGGISFCNLSEVHSIPFKIVYLLGMNANTYPSHKAVSDINLMAHNTRCGDYNQNYNDRYFFLEALLSARNKFFISFIDYSMFTGTQNFPSILVNELFEYIINNFVYLEKGKKNFSLLTIEWMYTNFLIRHAHTPYSLKNFINKNKYQSFFKEWLPNINCDFKKSHVNFISKLPPVFTDQISLSTLYNFYLHPIRFWFKNRLKINIPIVLDYPNNESFVVDYLTQYQLDLQLIDIFLNKKDLDSFYQNIRSSGYLPYRNFGEVFWIKRCYEMKKLSKKICKFYCPHNKHDLKISLFLGNIQLHGTLFSVQKNGVLRWKPARLSVKDGLLFWIEHLIYCAIGGLGDSRMFGMNTQWHFASLSVSEAKQHLLYLIRGYCNGMEEPLFLFNYFGSIWLKYCFNIETKNISLDLACHHKARNNIILAWENKYIYKENLDPYIKKIIPNKIQNKDIDLIISATKDYFLLPMIFNIANDVID